MQYVTDLSKYQTENRTAVTLGKFDKKRILIV